MKIRVSRVVSEERKAVKEADLAWADAVKGRDGWFCVVCGVSERLNAHHILPREVKEFKYVVDNGITLCVTHHKFSRELSAHNNSFAFLLWFMVNRKAQFERLRLMWLI